MNHFAAMVEIAAHRLLRSSDIDSVHARRMMSDYNVTMCGDSATDFTVLFKGPKDSACAALLV